MNEKKVGAEETRISFFDLKLMIKKSRKKILLGVFLFAFLAASFSLLRQPHYSAQATFREKAKSAAESGKPLSLALLAGGGDSNEYAAISLMKSRRLLEKIIQEKNLQAFVEKDKTSFIKKRLGYLRDHLKVEWALLRDHLEPAIDNFEQPLNISELNYGEEIPLELKAVFYNEHEYHLATKTGVELGSGMLGRPFIAKNFKFTILRNNDDPLTDQSFKITLRPVYFMAEKMVKCLVCESDSKDKSLLKLAYRDPNRFKAAEIVNNLMKAYQEYLKEEHVGIVNEQIAYLNRRQDEATSKLKTMMQEHASALSNNMATIDFYFQQQQAYTQKLLAINLELRRLDKAKNEGSNHYERYLTEGSDPLVVAQYINEIRAYKQQSDAIDIALRNIAFDEPEQLKNSFAKHMEELENVRCCAKEARAILNAMEKQTPLPHVAHLLVNPKYMINEWIVRLDAHEMDGLHSKEKKHQMAENATSYKSQFNAYLTNLIHILDVEEKLIQERLTHQQSPQLEFQGIDLSTANQLYITHSKSLNDVEAEMVHYAFLIDQLKDPNFEPSSLSTVLSDPVSVAIINKTSGISLMLKDSDNRSHKELDRLKNELAQQKSFLTIHLEQTLQLLNLRKKLFQEKILAVQNAQLELIQQKISILEKHLQNYVENRIYTLKQELSTIEQQQVILKKEMGKMPEKWASEKLIDQHLEMSKKMIEEITKLVESKNISSNLDISQSSPVDTALPPIHPMRSKVLVYAIIGGVFGFMLTLFSIVAKAVVRGVPATQHNLKLDGQHVVGIISKSYRPEEPMLDGDLDTLRRLATYMNASTEVMKKGQSLLLMISSGYDYSKRFAQLLSKGGFKVLLMPISFDEVGNANEQPGLLQYLQGDVEMPKIQKVGEFDYIGIGGISRFSSELIGSRKFYDLLNSLQPKYDWIVAVSKASPEDGEGESLINVFDHAAITITKELLPDLAYFLAQSHAHKHKKISYIFAEHKYRPEYKNY